MQFHPTVLYMAGSAHHLLTEAIRGEGAFLRDRYGERFMPAYHPLAELAPRDDVSQAIAAQMVKTRHPNVYLDLSHLDPDLIRRRFPGIDRLCRNFDLDITRDPIPVCPGAHYMIGGVTVDTPRADLATWTLGGRRSHQLGPPRCQSAGLQQPARRTRLRFAGGRGHRLPTGPGRAPAARSTTRLGSPTSGVIIPGIDLDDLRKSLARSCGD